MIIVFSADSSALAITFRMSPATPPKMPDRIPPRRSLPRLPNHEVVHARRRRRSQLLARRDHQPPVAVLPQHRARQAHQLPPRTLQGRCSRSPQPACMTCTETPRSRPSPDPRQHPADAACSPAPAPPRPHARACRPPTARTARSAAPPSPPPRNSPPRTTHPPANARNTPAHHQSTSQDRTVDGADGAAIDPTNAHPETGALTGTVCDPAGSEQPRGSSADHAPAPADARRPSRGAPPRRHAPIGSRRRSAPVARRSSPRPRTRPPAPTNPGRPPRTRTRATQTPTHSEVSRPAHHSNPLISVDAEPSRIAHPNTAANDPTCSDALRPL